MNKKYRYVIVLMTTLLLGCQMSPTKDNQVNNYKFYDFERAENYEGLAYCSPKILQIKKIKTLALVESAQHKR